MKLDFSWRVHDDTVDQDITGSLLEMQIMLDRSSLYIRANTLRATHDYSFSLFASAATNPLLNNSATTRVTVSQFLQPETCPSL